LHSVSPIHTIDSGNNLSDHLPIATQVPVSPSVTCNSRNSLKRDETLHMRWDKANLHAYYNTTYENLYAVADMECLDNCSMHCDCSRHGIIDNYYLCVVHALQTADTYSVPRKKASYYKFWWNVEASELKYKSVDAHRLWVVAGRPRNGDCFNRMHNAKLQYKLCLRKLRKADTEGISNELNDCYCRRIRTVFGSVGKVSLIHQNLLYMLLMVVLMILTLLKHLSTFSVGSVDPRVYYRMTNYVISFSLSLKNMWVQRWTCLFR